MRLKFPTILALVLLLAPGCAHAVSPLQQPHKAAAAPSSENQAILEGADQETAVTAAQQELANANLVAAEADYKAWSYRNAKQAYEWQDISTVVIFIVVFLLMVAGVVFSWIQFREGMHNHPLQAVASSVSTIAQPALSSGNGIHTASEVSIEKSAVTEVSASPHGVKIASSTLGVIILVISMCFFYMYLSYVYPISIQNANQAINAAKHTAAK